MQRPDLCEQGTRHSSISRRRQALALVSVELWTVCTQLISSSRRPSAASAASTKHEGADLVAPSIVVSETLNGAGYRMSPPRPGRGPAPAGRPGPPEIALARSGSRAGAPLPTRAPPARPGRESRRSQHRAGFGPIGFVWSLKDRKLTQEPKCKSQISKVPVVYKRMHASRCSDQRQRLGP